MKEKFNNIKESYPLHSSFYHFELLIKGKKMTRTEITKWMSKFVDKEDYMGCNKRHLIDYLVKYSDGTVDGVIKKIKENANKKTKRK